MISLWYPKPFLLANIHPFMSSTNFQNHFLPGLSSGQRRLELKKFSFFFLSFIMMTPFSFSVQSAPTCRSPSYPTTIPWVLWHTYLSSFPQTLLPSFLVHHISLVSASDPPQTVSIRKSQWTHWAGLM